MIFRSVVKSSDETPSRLWLPAVYSIGKWLLIPLGVFYFVQLLDYSHTLSEHNGFLLQFGRKPVGADFINWWTSAKLILKGDYMSMFDIKQFVKAQESIVGPSEFKNWSYPPHVFTWIWVLGLLPYGVALAAWTVVGFAVYAFAIAYKTPHPWMLALILGLAPASYVNVMSGQTAFIAAACLIGGLRIMDRFPILAGVLFGFLTFKPQYGIFVPLALLMGCRWRTIAATIVTAAVLVGASIFMFGWEPWHAYLNTTIPIQRNALEHGVDGEPYQLMMISPFMLIRFMGLPLEPAYALTAIAALASVGSIVAVFRQPRSPELCTAVVVTATVLASPYMFNYDTVALNGALVAMVLYTLGASNGTNRTYWLRPLHIALFVTIWLLPLGTMNLMRFSMPVYPFLIAALLLMQVWWAAHSSPPEATA